MAWNAFKIFLERRLFKLSAWKKREKLTSTKILLFRLKLKIGLKMVKPPIYNYGTGKLAKWR